MDYRSLEQIVAVHIGPRAAGNSVGRAVVVILRLVRSVNQHNIVGIHAHTGLSRDGGHNGRSSGSIHNLDIVAALEELHLPAEDGIPRSGIIGRCGKFHHQDPVGRCTHHLGSDMTEFREVSVTTHEIDLGVVVPGIRAAKRGRIVARACRCGSESQVTVRVDGILRVVGPCKVEGKADGLYRRSHTVARRTDKRRGRGQCNPLGGIHARGEIVIFQTLCADSYSKKAEEHHKKQYILFHKTYI